MAVLRSTAFSSSHRGPTPPLFRGPILAVLLLAAPLHSPAQPSVAREYQVKAVFLFNFAQFVSWPPAAFPSEKEPLVIGVLGEDPFGPFLDEVVEGESASGRALTIRRYQRPEEIDTCHILYIGQSEAARLRQIAKRLEGRAILTVSDIEGAARDGVMIRFFSERKRIRLRINLVATRAAGLVLSSKLLRPADILENEEGTP